MALSDYKFDIKLGDKVNLAHIKMSKQAVAIKSYKKDEENVQYILIEKRVGIFFYDLSGNTWFRFYWPVRANTFRNYFLHSKPMTTFISYSQGSFIIIFITLYNVE